MPIKRSLELQPLSKDHHDGLLLCWKIRSGLKSGVAEARIRAYVRYVFEQELEEHFRQEEELVFVLLADSDEQKLEALAQHRLLRTLMKEIEGASGGLKLLLERFADQLDQHIRFEERQLFPYIESKAEKLRFSKAGLLISQLHQHRRSLAWADEFWIINR